MAQTTSSSDRDLEKLGVILARETDAEVDSLMAEFDRLIEHSKRRDSEEDFRLLINSAGISAFAEFEDFFQRVSVILMLSSATRLSAIYDIALPGKLNQTRVRAAQAKLQTRLNGFIDEARLLAQVTQCTGTSISTDLVFTPRNIDSLKKATEFTASFSANHGIFLAGQQAFSRKRAVAVLDKDTTNLCRHRMNGQVVPWDGYFVDPVSGSRWVHPPFVGGELSPSELFHPCRTVVTPA